MLIQNFVLVVLLALFGDYVKCQSVEGGSVCEWEGQVNSIQGTCVPPRRCLTALDDQSPTHPVCSTKNGENMICCTDCKLVNDTSDAVIIPSAGVFWKTGQKAHDKCLEYRRDLPYTCNTLSPGGLLRTLDIQKECHTYGLWWANKSESSGKPRTEFPYHARLTYHDGSRCSGTIISENFILALPQCADFTQENTIKKIDLGIINRWDDLSNWQILEAKRIIPHPQYLNTSAYHYIALVETKTPIVFNKNVLPACLQTDDTVYSDAVFTTWRDPKIFNKDARKLWSMPQKKFGGHVCDEAYSTTHDFTRGFDKETQLCFGDEDVEMSCKAKSGEPLVVRNDKLGCMDTVIGMTTYSSLCGDEGDGLNVYARMPHFIPWIESIVWP